MLAAGWHYPRAAARLNGTPAHQLVEGLLRADRVLRALATDHPAREDRHVAAIDAADVLADTAALTAALECLYPGRALPDLVLGPPPRRRSPPTDGLADLVTQVRGAIDRME